MPLVFYLFATGNGVVKNGTSPSIVTIGVYASEIGMKLKWDNNFGTNCVYVGVKYQRGKTRRGLESQMVLRER